MGIFSTHKTQQWKPVWTYSARGVLWRFLFSPAGHLIGEARDPESRTTTYFCLNEVTGEPFWENLALDETWWIGIEEATENAVYLHRYKNADSPQHKGIIAVDIRTGNLLWENQGAGYAFSTDSTVYAAHEMFEGWKYFALDARSGEFIREFGQDASAFMPLRDERDAGMFVGYRYPELYDDSSAEHAALRTIVAKHVPASRISGSLEILIEDHLVGLAWHEPSKTQLPEQTFNQHFMAVSLDAMQVVFHDQIRTDAPLVSLDSFFAKGDLVFYVKDTHILTAHSLI